MALTLKPIAHSEIGLVRKTNQDSGYVTTSTLIVADGMGGAAAGDLASALAIRDLCHIDDAPLEEAEVLPALEDLVFDANAQIAEMIAIDPALDGMGTTVCGGTCDGHRMNIVHIGDSRGYLLRKGVLRRLTHDHSYVQSLIDDGRLGETEAMNHPHRSLLLKVLNGQPEIKPDFFSTDLEADDRIMFCSDGLCGLVGDSIIGTIMKLPELDDVMTTLIELAHAAGGTDNITIIMADVVEVKAISGPEDEPGAQSADDRPDIEHTEQISEHTQRLSVGDTLQETLPTGAYPTSGLLGAAADPDVIAMLESLRGGESSPTASDQPSGAAKLTAAQQERRRYAPTVKKSRKGLLLILLAVLVVLGGAGGGLYAYVSSQYFVGESDGTVAIFQGLPGDVAGIDTWRVYETTTISLSDLPISWRDKVRATIPSSGLDQARASVAELSSKSQQCVAERNARPPGSLPPVDGC